MSNALRERIAGEHAATVAALAAVARDGRHRALTEFLARGLPSAREENWRYANLRPLDKALFQPPTAPAAIDAALLPQALEDHARHVFVDGLYAPGLCTPAGLSTAAAGVSVGTGTAPRALSEARGSDESFALLNDAFAADGASITVAPGADARIEVLFIHTGPAASYPRLTARVGANARLSLIERHLAPEDAAGLVATAIAIAIGDGAVIDHYRLQQSGSQAVWLDTLSATVGHAACYNSHVLQLGALSARSTAHVALAQPQATLVFNAVSLADGRQVHDNMVVVDHQSPHTRTEQNFRGIAGLRARIAFNGKIIVRGAARKADSAQSLRGLITGQEAEIDVRPQLEIYTDDVRCSHGATTGKLDENMLFYLLSRGLEPDMAQRVLKWAFITDIVARIAPPRLQQQAREALVGHMQDADALKELL